MRTYKLCIDYGTEGETLVEGWWPTILLALLLGPVVAQVSVFGMTQWGPRLGRPFPKLTIYGGE